MTQDQKVVDALARRLGAHMNFVLRDSYGARADPYNREVYLPRWGYGTKQQDNELFWTALHELGHIANQHTGSGFLYSVGGARGAEVVLEQEAQAWVWAIEHAERPLDDVGRATIVGTLPSYMQGTGYIPAQLGPNLQRVLDLVGTNVNPQLVAQVEPRFVNHALKLWDRAQARHKLAA